MPSREFENRRRRSVRLPGYDYCAPAAYFVTICAFNRAPLFGECQDGVVCLSEAGRIAAMEWRNVGRCVPTATLDEWIVMPDHLHGIIVLAPTDGPPSEIALAAWRANQSRFVTVMQASATGPAPRSLGAIIGTFKSVTTNRINVARRTPGMRVWQRGYYERVIRDEAALAKVRQYIAANPSQWSVRRSGSDHGG
jgi:putative transposase